MEATVGELMELARQKGHTRYPIYDDDIDDIVGVAGIPSVFELPRAERADTPVTDLMTEPKVIPETRDLVDVLDDFQQSSDRLLVVVDEHGGTAGIIDARGCAGRNHR